MTGRRHGKGRAQIVRPIGKHVRQGQLRASEYHRQIDARQHEGHGGGGIGHGVRAVGNHNSVVSDPFLKNMSGQQLPFLRTDIGGVQANHVLHPDIVIGAQLVQLPLHHVRALRLQAVPAGQGGNGAAGGQQQDFLLGVHSPAPSWFILVL